MNNPIVYDIGDFARHFTWSLLHWNSAEFNAKVMLAQMLGGTKPVYAVVVDMGNRSVLHGLEAAGRELPDAEAKDHITHFSDGFRILLGYRNLYVHNLREVSPGGRTGKVVKLVGRVNQMKGEGRLKSIKQELSLEKIAIFREHCRAFSGYATAILALLDPKLKTALGKHGASLEKPTWPACLQNTPDYLQEGSPQPEPSRKSKRPRRGGEDQKRRPVQT